MDYRVEGSLRVISGFSVFLVKPAVNPFYPESKFPFKGLKPQVFPPTYSESRKSLIPQYPRFSNGPWFLLRGKLPVAETHQLLFSSLQEDGDRLFDICDSIRALCFLLMLAIALTDA